MTVSIFPTAPAINPEIRMSWELDPRAQDPVGWTGDRLEEYMWSKERHVAESVRDNRHTAVPSAHGTGKSHTASRLVAWWLETHDVGDAFVVTTAPTASQVRAVLWRYINQAHVKGQLAGRITQGDVPEWKMGFELVGYGRKPADYVDPTTAAAAFQGIHARYLLVILDEACGIPTWLWDAVDTLATNEDARVLAIGNPDDPASHFEGVCRPGSGWNVIPISAFDLPCFIGTPEYTGTPEMEEIDRQRPEELDRLLTGKTWVEERAKRWGVDSPIYISKVLGQFPEIGDDTLISPALIRAAMERELPGLATGRAAADIARFGKDRSVAYRNRDGVIRKVGDWAKKDTMETAGKLVKIQEPFNGGLPMWIDVNGVGAGVFDRMRELDMNVAPFNGAEKANEPERYKNVRAESYWNMRDLFEDGLLDLDPNDLDLQAQLGSILWKVDSGGRIQIESKDDIIKRLGVSPDHADAATMACREMGVENLHEFLQMMEKNRKPAISDGMKKEPW